MGEPVPGTRKYLGDSVYGYYDGLHIMLTTENGGPPSNVILLEPEVLEALDKYREFIRSQYNAPVIGSNR